MLCGYDLERRCVYIMNPSLREGVCCAKIDVFEKARHSYGTDDDILLIDMSKQAESLMEMKEQLSLEGNS